MCSIWFPCPCIIDNNGKLDNSGFGAEPHLGYYLAEECFKMSLARLIAIVWEMILKEPHVSITGRAAITIRWQRNNISISPYGRLAVVIDNLDRGYSEIQCAFVPVKENTLKEVAMSRHKPLLLIKIYYTLHDEFIGRTLLEIAGRRLKLYVNISQGTFLKKASVAQQHLTCC
ncbi:rab3 GTPase-activating protein non-catalytic subunit-like isoform X2 [Stomoxys calcitrans]|nr:rab3 GTPase-activating protein non-catalytic subunit-like isoform X2 [Stomoxys calcitrans]